MPQLALRRWQRAWDAALAAVFGAALFSVGFGCGEAEDDPAARWLSIYAWLRTAERLSEGGHLPLALGGYLEASRRIERLAEDHPAFEPEMLAYRQKALAETVAAMEEELTDDGHGTMMRFLDFVESLEAGERQRYANEFDEAYETLTMARSILEELSEEKPASFREAVAPHAARIESNLEWLGSQLDHKASSALAARASSQAAESIDWGTTRFVKESDLPTSAEGGLAESSLFPGGKTDGESGAAEEAEPSAAGGEPGSAGPRFRMSSRQSSAPE